MVNITFKMYECPKCKQTNHQAILKAGRWAIYCRECGHFIKWADKGQKAVIEARKAWESGHNV